MLYLHPALQLSVDHPAIKIKVIWPNEDLTRDVNPTAGLDTGLSMPAEVLCDPALE